MVQFQPLAAPPLAFILQSILGRIALALIIMAMQAESLEVLENADVPSAQARAIVRAIEIELAGAKDTLATKHDLLLLRQEMVELRGDLRQEMVELRSGLRQEIAGVRSDLRQEIAELGGELRQEMVELRTGLRQEIAAVHSDLRQEIAELNGGHRQEIAQQGGGLRQEIAQQGGGLRAEMHGMASSITRQMYMALLGQMAVLLGIAYFFVTNVNV